MNQFTTIDLALLSKNSLSPMQYILISQIVSANKDASGYASLGIEDFVQAFSLPIGEISSILSSVPLFIEIEKESGQLRATPFASEIFNESLSYSSAGRGLASVSSSGASPSGAVVASKKVTVSSLKKKNLESDRVVSSFIQERKNIQPDFDIELSSGIGKYKEDPYAIMRAHLADRSHARTADRYHAMIRWLFYTNSKESQFWRKTIVTIGGLIRNFDRVELASMGNKEDHQLKKTIEARVSVMRKHGCPEAEIIAEVTRLGGGNL